MTQTMEMTNTCNVQGRKANIQVDTLAGLTNSHHYNHKCSTQMVHASQNHPNRPHKLANRHYAISSTVTAAQSSIQVSACMLTSQMVLRAVK